MSTPTTTKTILVTAASGKIGKRLIPLLLTPTTLGANPPTLILPTTNPSRLAALLPENNPRIHIADGSIQDPQWLEATLRAHAVDTVFICLTGENELFVTLNMISALQRVGTVRRVVYISGCGNYDSAGIANGMLQEVCAGHVLVKFAVEAKLRYGCVGCGWETIIVGPTLFFDNDLRSKAAMVQRGVFDEPLGEVGVSRVSVADIARVSAKALLTDEKKWLGQKINVGTFERYTGTQTAELWGQALGKEVKTLSGSEEDMEKLEQHFRRGISPAWARDMRLMYAQFHKQGFGPTEEEYKVQVEFMGKEPEKYEDFVKETAGKWLNEGGQ